MIRPLGSTHRFTHEPCGPPGTEYTSSTLKPSGTLRRLIGVALFSPIAGPTPVGRVGKVGASGCAALAVTAPPDCAASAAAFFAFPPLPFFAAFGAGVVVSAAKEIAAPRSAITMTVIERAAASLEDIIGLKEK